MGSGARSDRLGDVTASAAGTSGDRVAVVSEVRTCTYAALDDRVRRLAGALADGVVAPGARVATLLHNRVEVIECLYGVPSAGAVLVPLDPRLHPRELVEILNHCGARALVVEASLAGVVDRILADCPRLAHVIGIGPVLAADLEYEALMAGAAAPGPRVHADDLALLLYAGAPTARPRGTMLTHRNVLAGARNWMIDAGLDARSVGYLGFPLCRATGLVTVGFFLARGRVLLRRRHDPGDFLRAVDEEGVTSTLAVPTFLDDVLQRPDLDDFDLSRVRAFLPAGAAPAARVLAAAMARFPAARFPAGLALPELAGTVPRLGDGDAAAARCSVRLVDDDMADVAAGEVGELVVRGEQVSRGYWEDPVATAQAHRGGWFHTGARFRAAADGALALVDRRDDVVVSGGEWVSAPEVEDVLRRAPDVAEVAVVGVPHPRWGEAVCAAVVPMPGTEPDEAALVAHVRAHLAAYKRPQRVVFVDALPRGADGAVRRRHLRGDLARRRLFARAAPHLGKSTGSGGAVSARARARA